MLNIGLLLPSGSRSSSPSIVANESSFIAYSSSDNPSIYPFKHVYTPSTPFYNIYQSQIQPLLQHGQNICINLIGPQQLRNTLLLGYPQNSAKLTYEHFSSSLLGLILSSVFTSQTSISLSWFNNDTHNELFSSPKLKPPTSMPSLRHAVSAVLSLPFSSTSSNSVIEITCTPNSKAPPLIITIVSFGPSSSLSFPPCVSSVLNSMESKRPHAGFSRSRLTKPLHNYWCRNGKGITLTLVSGQPDLFSECNSTLKFSSRVASCLSSIPPSPRTFVNPSPIPTPRSDPPPSASSLHSPQTPRTEISMTPRSPIVVDVGHRLRELSKSSLRFETRRDEDEERDERKEKFKKETNQVRKEVRNDSNDVRDHIPSREVATLQNHLKHTRNELKEVHTHRVVLESQLARLKEDNESKSSEINSLREKLSAKSNIIRRLEKEKDKLCLENERLVKASQHDEDLSATIVSLRREIKKLNNGYEKVKKERDQLKNDLSEHLEMSMSKNSDFDNLLQSSDELQLKLESETSRRIELEEQVYELSESLKEELSRKNDILDQEQLVRQATHKRTQKLVFDLENRIKELTRENQELNSMIFKN
ncbi:hypothetical protein P9112_008083 [Eukaryota sp. TZLM1-RC]